MVQNPPALAVRPGSTLIPINNIHHLQEHDDHYGYECLEVIFYATLELKRSQGMEETMTSSNNSIVGPFQLITSDDTSDNYSV
uniref:Uncharacterized protein n=1 Tax=Sphaerodactylus townsendi TaxID=933632 RepID=A0ACB8E6V1_9SAUR